MIYNSRKKWQLYPGLFLLIIAVLGLLTMLLWNAVVPDLFQLPELGYWQATGLLVLARLLFGGTPFRHNPYTRIPIQERMKRMSPEEREEFRKRMTKFRNSHWHYCPDPEEQTSKTETKKD